MAENNEKPVYLDHNATTPPSKEALEALRSFEDWGNPSSIHKAGRGAKSVLLRARRKFAEYLNVAPGELIFTSGGSESNNTALKGVLNKLKERGQTHILTSAVEHPSVLKALESIEEQGDFVLHRVPVTVEDGLDYTFLEKCLKEHPIGLVSVMFANNETGELFDLKKIKSLIDECTGENKIYFHSDMVQSLGKASFDLKDLNVDLATFSAHKFYALQGFGVLYQKKGVGLESLIHGGGQERGRRAGTENLSGALAFGAQLEQLNLLETKLEEMKRLRDRYEEKIKTKVSGVSFLSQDRPRVPNTSLTLIEGVHGETLLMNLDLKGFYVSTGAACSSGNPEPSPVLIAMGLSPEEATHSLRVSLGWNTTEEQIDHFVEELSKVIQKLRNL